MKDLIVERLGNYVRAAYVVDGVLVDTYVDRPDIGKKVGNIYKGRVEAVLSGMTSAFVNIGLDKNAYYYAGDSLVDIRGLMTDRPIYLTHPRISPGDLMLCQVTKEAFGDKGARITTNVTVPGRFLVLMPNSRFVAISRRIEDVYNKTRLMDFVSEHRKEDRGYIIRTAAVNASDEEILEEIEALESQWNEIQKAYNLAPPRTEIYSDNGVIERAIRDTLSYGLDRILVNDQFTADQIRNKIRNPEIVELDIFHADLFSHVGISTQLRALAEKRVNLKSGAFLYIEKTEALTVVDVNTGSFIGTSGLEDTVYTTNLEAADEIARQLRLRNIGGIIIIDFIDMTLPQHQKAVVDRLREALKSDVMRTNVSGVTPLGLVEVTRKKARYDTDVFLSQPCPYCGNGRIKSYNVIAFEIKEEVEQLLSNGRVTGIIVEVNPKMYEAVISRPYLLHATRNMWSKYGIYYRANPDFHIEKYVLTPIYSDSAVDYDKLIKLN